MDAESDPELEVSLTAPLPFTDAAGADLRRRLRTEVAARKPDLGLLD